MAEDNTPSFLRDDAGRFASSKEPAAEPVTPVDPTPTEPPKVETPAPAQTVEPQRAEPVIPPGYIPLAAQLDEREKRQAAERKFEELQRKYEEATKKPPAELDPIGDQQGFVSHFEQQIARTKWDTLTTLSRTWAVKAHGEETVKAAEDAIKAEVERNPGFFQTIERQPDPYDFGVSWHKRQQALSEIGDNDPKAWARTWAEANGYVLKPTDQPAASVAGTPSPTTPTPLPRASLASAPAAGGNAPRAPIGPGVAFGEVFK